MPTETAVFGTLPPIVMNSRIDGSLLNLDLYGDSRVNILCKRYSPDDALCYTSNESRPSIESMNQSALVKSDSSARPY
ncbi:MAG: hypothetical protein WBG38_18370 [Nodosilinea sp.]